MSRRSRRILRHLLLAVAGISICFATPYLLEPVSMAQTISLGTAYASLFCVAITLSLGPINILRSQNNPVSSMVRRDFGIWAAVFGIVHVVAGLNVHFGGRFWVYFIYPLEDQRAFPIRYDPMGVANHTGLIVTIILVLLLLLSNNASLRRLQPHRWKRLQKWNYVLGGLLVVHGLIYQFLETRLWGAVAVLLAVSALTGLLQLFGFRRHRRNLTAKTEGSTSSSSADTSNLQPSASG